MRYQPLLEAKFHGADITAVAETPGASADIASRVGQNAAYWV